MDRRQFLGLTMGTLATGVVIGRTSRAGPDRTIDSGLSNSPTDAAAWNASRRFVSTRFGHIAYTDRGSGQAALFLHGFPLNSFQWRGALDRLSAYRRCIAPDSLGLGYTEVAEGVSVTPATQVQMLTALLDKLAISDVDLIANDSGGAVAQLLLTQHPDRVRTVLLTNCDVENNCPPPAVIPVIELAKLGRFADEWPRRDDLYLSRPACRRNHRHVSRPVGGIATTQGANQRVRYRPRTESFSRHRAFTEKEPGTCSYHLGYRRHHFFPGRCCIPCQDAAAFPWRAQDRRSKAFLPGRVPGRYRGGSAQALGCADIAGANHQLT